MLHFLTLLCVTLLFSKEICSSQQMNFNYDPANWMQNLAQFIQDKSLKDIAIPGTHDSATSKLSSSSDIAKKEDVPKELDYLKFIGVGFIVNKVIATWAKAQGDGIKKQLYSGIRYLDLRFSYRDSKKTHYTVHGLYGDSVDNILKEIKDFTDDHPKEIIVIKIDGFNYMKSTKYGDTHQILIDKFKNTFGDKLVPDSYGPFVPVKRLWEEGRQVILIYFNEEWAVKEPLLWSKNNTINDRWANAQKTSALKQKLDSYLQQRPDDKFFVLQAQLTPDGGTIKKSFIPFSKSPGSLKALAKMVEKELLSWIDGWKSTYQQNIVITDFPSQQIIRKIIDLNIPMS
ncbi:MAG: hypothetical protein ACTSXG_03750 [Alphaproteobacteria bacterium]